MTVTTLKISQKDIIEWVCNELQNRNIRVVPNGKFGFTIIPRTESDDGKQQICIDVEIEI